MIRVLQALTPIEFQETEKLFLYYLKTLSDRIYKRSVPEVSRYELQILKQFNKIIVVNHGHYNTTSTEYTFKQLEEIIAHYFKQKDASKPQMCEEIQFVMDLRF